MDGVCLATVPNRHPDRNWRSRPDPATPVFGRTAFMSDPLFKPTFSNPHPSPRAMHEDGRPAILFSPLALSVFAIILLAGGTFLYFAATQSNAPVPSVTAAAPPDNPASEPRSIPLTAPPQNPSPATDPADAPQRADNIDPGIKSGDPVDPVLIARVRVPSLRPDRPTVIETISVSPGVEAAASTPSVRNGHMTLALGEAESRAGGADASPQQQGDKKDEGPSGGNQWGPRLKPARHHGSGANNAQGVPNTVNATAAEGE